MTKLPVTYVKFLTYFKSFSANFLSNEKRWSNSYFVILLYQYFSRNIVEARRGKEKARRRQIVADARRGKEEARRRRFVAKARQGGGGEARRRRGEGLRRRGEAEARLCADVR